LAFLPAAAFFDASCTLSESVPLSIEASLFLISIVEVVGLSFFSLSSPSPFSFFFEPFPVPFFPLSSSVGFSVSGTIIGSLNLYSGSCQVLSGGNSGNVDI